MEIIKTSSRGQIVIPEEVRKRHKIKEGTKLVLLEDDDRIILEKEEVFEALVKRKMHVLGQKEAETLNLMMASEKSLAKDWNSEEDDVWDKLY